MTLGEALALMGLTVVPEQPEELARAYRTAAKAAHPDAGGTDEAMQALTTAKALIEAAEPGSTPDDGRQRCAFCRGTGRLQSGFTQRECSTCGGTGYVAKAAVSETPAQAAGYDPIADMVADLPDTWSIDSRRRTARRLWNAGWRKPQ